MFHHGISRSLWANKKVHYKRQITTEFRHCFVNKIKMAKRFIVMSDKDLEDKSKKCKNDNTLKAEKKADKAFTKFLITMGIDSDKTNYWNYDEPTLDNYLSKFWFGARKEFCDNSQDNEKDPKMKDRLYKATSLRSFRYGLNRILKQHGHLYDITDKRTVSFQKSQQAFVNAIKELKSEEKGDIESYSEITETGKTWIHYKPACCF